MSRRYQNKEQKKKLHRQLTILAACLVVIAIVGVILFRVIDQKKIADTDKDEDSIQTVEIGGKKYVPRNGIKTYLFMGIDSSGESEAKESYDGTGQCDVLELLVVDQNANAYTVLPINRDTITMVKSLEDDGTFIAESDVQIALAHANGDGMEVSCENTVDAVSNYLYGQKIDGYAALGMDAIPIINHELGGVTVTIEDDFSDSDPTLEMGKTVTLNDEQAVHFVRGRMDVADGTNENRMKRQSTYKEAAQKKFTEKCSEDDGYVMDFYNAVQDYMVTDLTKKDFSKLAKAMLKDESRGELEIKGESSLDYLGYKQFIPDQESVDEVVVKLFYDPA